MGFYIDTLEIDVRVPSRHIAAATDDVRNQLGCDDDTLIDAAHMVGFEDSYVMTDGTFCLSWYSEKTNIEDDFLNALAPYVEPNSYVIWRSEDNALWANIFVDGQLVELDVHLTIAGPVKQLWEERPELSQKITDTLGLIDAYREREVR